ncbi:MAG: amino acid permease [Verrucomicrobiota bacterium]|nr:amino acid permease [Verrucomicrobiota bacterium]
MGHKFGTFAGVFTPSILTILGLIMFMRTGLVIGKMGVGGALLILLVASSISLATGLSLSAISTNTPVSAGGVYFLISRTLGLGYGGAIGVMLFLAQALSIPFYILGFAESLANTFPHLKDYYLIVSLLVGILLFFLSWVGAHWAIKVQFFILAALSLGIFAFMAGAALQFSPATLSENFKAVPDVSAYRMFALFFPAMTGIMAGVNMSGDLKDPQKSIPKGTIAAIVVGVTIYVLQIVLCGGAFSRETLINKPYISLVQNALWGTGYLVTAGVFCATVSSAIGSFLGAPRVLQALSQDKIYSTINVFAKLEGKNKEPRRALILSKVITFGIILWAGAKGLSDSGMSPALNAVSAIVTMFFLYTYGMVNVATFVESFGSNPSFRPRFRFFHWSIALIGALACFVLSFVINPIAAFVAIIIMLLLFMSARKKVLEQTFGDARRGFVYSRIRNNLFKLRKMPVNPKNWRPTIAVLTGNPTSRLSLLQFALKLEGGCGIVSMTEILVGKFDKLKEMRKQEYKRLNNFIDEQDIEVIPEVLVTPDFDEGLFHFLQCHSIGPIKPNIVMLGWPEDEQRIKPFVSHLEMIIDLGKSCVIMVDTEDRPCPIPAEGGRIDIWWRGKNNGSLMMMLAHLLQENKGWEKTTIRLLRLVESKEGVEPAEKALKQLSEDARIEAENKAIFRQNRFKDIFRRESKDADVIFLGFIAPEEDKQLDFYHRYDEFLQGMPPAFLISSAGDADMLA